MKIPAQAKSVFKGEIFEVFQWEQELFDGSMAIFEMTKRDDTTEVIAVKDGLIWFAEQEQPMKGVYQSFFGGRVEPGEDSETGAIRELEEESGMIPGSLEKIFSVMPLSKTEWTNHYYIARDCQLTSAINLDPGEKITIKSCTFEELIEKILSQQIRTSPFFVLEIYRMKYQAPLELAEFKKKLGLV